MCDNIVVISLYFIWTISKVYTIPKSQTTNISSYKSIFKLIEKLENIYTIMHKRWSAERKLKITIWKNRLLVGYLIYSTHFTHYINTHYVLQLNNTFYVTSSPKACTTYPTTWSKKRSYQIQDGSRIRPSGRGFLTIPSFTLRSININNTTVKLK